MLDTYSHVFPHMQVNAVAKYETFLGRSNRDSRLSHFRFGTPASGQLLNRVLLSRNLVSLDVYRKFCTNIMSPLTRSFSA
jgi:hypothetical protein